QNRASLFAALEKAGYGADAETVSDLVRNNQAEFARIALRARQQNIIHDGYEELLAMGGVPKTERAAQRVAAAKKALAGGEAGVLAFLSDAAERQRILDQNG